MLTGIVQEIVQPVFFLSILIVVTQILPDPKYGSFTNETATVPISLQRAILSLSKFAFEYQKWRTCTCSNSSSSLANVG